jgi:lysozyme
VIEFGPDLYHNDSDSSFLSALGGRAPGIILKATQGSSFVDPKFVMRARLVMNAGKLLGAYHFCDASPYESQAKLFLSVAGGIAGRLALDIEQNTSAGGTILIPDAANFALALSAAGHEPLIYMPLFGPTGDGAGLPNKALSRFPLWAVDYRPGSTPRLPAGWSVASLWQYTDSPVDTNRWNGSLANLKKFWLST